MIKNTFIKFQKQPLADVFHKEKLVLEILFNRVVGLKSITSTHGFLECGEIFRNIYFQEHMRTAASVLLIIQLVISSGHLPNFSS